MSDEKRTKKKALTPDKIHDTPSQSFLKRLKGIKFMKLTLKN